MLKVLFTKNAAIFLVIQILQGKLKSDESRHYSAFASARKERRRDESCGIRNVRIARRPPGWTLSRTRALSLPFLLLFPFTFPPLFPLPSPPFASLPFLFFLAPLVCLPFLLFPYLTLPSITSHHLISLPFTSPPFLSPPFTSLSLFSFRSIPFPSSQPHPSPPPSSHSPTTSSTRVGA